MLDFAVDDLDAFLTRLKAKGVTILKRDDSDPNGKYAWILDREGTKIELSRIREPHVFRTQRLAVRPRGLLGCGPANRLHARQQTRSRPRPAC